jgi:hypothetical protein
VHRCVHGRPKSSISRLLQSRPGAPLYRSNGPRVLSSKQTTQRRLVVGLKAGTRRRSERARRRAEGPSPTSS